MPKAPDPLVDPAAYLRSIGAVRERCSIVADLAQKNQLNHFHVDMSKFEDATSFVVSIIKVHCLFPWKLMELC
jgi:fibrillarin-like rRNA methylase